MTKEEVQNGVTADQYKHGLKRKPDGTWAWDDSGVKDTTSLDVLNSLASQDAVEAITNATPSHDSIEVKQELLEINHDDVVLNQNGKRPRKVSTRLFKRVCNPISFHSLTQRSFFHRAYSIKKHLQRKKILFP